jgi:beta-lactamase class D
MAEVLGGSVHADTGVAAATRTKKRLIIAVGSLLVVVVTVLGVLALRTPDDTADPAAAEATEAARALSASEVAGAFLDAVSAGDAPAAAALTDDPPGATATLTQVRAALRPTAVVADRTAPAAPPAAAAAAEERFTLTWRLGPERTWTYESVLPLVRNEAGWRVRWQPALVHPRLSPGHGLALRDRTGQPAVLDRDGAPLVGWTEDGTAATDPAVAPLLLPALGRVANGQGTAGGWYVALVDGAGADVEVLHGDRATALTTTLSRPVQHAAQAAVDTQQLPTMLVAVQPSTGDLLAVAQNSAAGKDPVALNGLYPPGSTFKIATAAAVLSAGAADIDTVLPCPGSVRAGERTVRNADFALGDVPLRTAFAQSCNTTFALQAANLPPDALPAAADALGLGADFDIPGITTEAGGVPAAATPAEQVENGIGQGTVQVSCFGLALVTATVATGDAVTPRLWRDLPTTVNQGYRAPTGDVVRPLRTMMREVVTAGTATGLAGHGGVFGKTGTAQVGDGTNAHGWFAGYRDDLAFATLVLDGSTSATAVDVTATFLGAVG